MGSICTGEFIGPVLRPDVSLDAPCVIGERPVQPNVLFDASSASEFSRSFQVTEGNCVLLTAYSLAGGTVQIEKLYIDPSANIPVSADGCVDPPAVPAPAILACKAVCSWMLTDCEDVRYVCAQGTYRLRVSPQSAIGQAFVVMERTQRTDQPLPEDMVLGA